MYVVGLLGKDLTIEMANFIHRTQRQKNIKVCAGRAEGEAHTEEG